MKKRYSEEQIVRILSEAQKGEVAVVCRRYGISDATYYNWRKRYEGMTALDLRKLKSLEEENRKLKKIVADKELDIDALKALLEKYSDAR
ncbi:MAG: transposase [Bdellovibrionota bacterium]|nr:MAG: transposase [Bdellovibrionota bacterium]WKZ57711.1 MAG: transposase [Bdellovibrionota bacterium]